MTRDEIIKFARAVGWDEMGADLWGAAFDGAMSIHALERFAALVAAAEREACAQMCDEAAIRLFSGKSRVNQVDRRTAEVLRSKAGAIRARSEK